MAGCQSRGGGQERGVLGVGYLLHVSLCLFGLFFALHFGICTAAFQLLGVVGSHVRKISEDVMVDLITWGKSRERQRHERHPQALGSSAPASVKRL